MTSGSLVQRINKALLTDDIGTLHSTLEELIGQGIDAERVDVLLSLLRDDDDHLHEMYAILHTIERAAPTLIYRALARHLPELRRQAPGWATRIVGRHLAADNSQGHGFDCRDFVEVFLGNADKHSVECLSELGAELAARGKLADGPRALLLSRGLL